MLCGFLPTRDSRDELRYLPRLDADLMPHRLRRAGEMIADGIRLKGHPSRGAPCRQRPLTADRASEIDLMVVVGHASGTGAFLSAR